MHCLNTGSTCPFALCAGLAVHYLPLKHVVDTYSYVLYAVMIVPALPAVVIIDTCSLVCAEPEGLAGMMYKLSCACSSCGGFETAGGQQAWQQY